MRCLLVEDEAFNLIVLEEMIKIFYPQAEIVGASNGQEAYELLQKERFDLILSDINMPVMDGYGLIKKIKGGVASSHTHYRRHRFCDSRG